MNIKIVEKRNDIIIFSSKEYFLRNKEIKKPGKKYKNAIVIKLEKYKNNS